MIFVNLEGRAGELVRATGGGVFKSGHIGLGLARGLIKKQMQNLATVAGMERGEASTPTTNEALLKVTTKFGGILPVDDRVDGLGKKAALDLLRDVRTALLSLGRELEWVGMGGEEEDRVEFSSASRESVSESK